MIPIGVAYNGPPSNLLAPNLTAAAATFGFSDAERDQS